MAKKYKHKLPVIDGFQVIIPIHKLNEALYLMWEGHIAPEEIDRYIMASWN